MQKPIGFIGQGWIGKNYADDFEKRGYKVIRYALEEPYVHNKDSIKDCEIVFVAVPTPTTPEGYSFTPVLDALRVVAPGSTVVIKSTLYPGTTETIQAHYPELYVIHSPEFLREAHAAYDAANPGRNLIGIPEATSEYTTRAERVLAVLPTAPYNKIMSAREAELVKYAGNCFLYTKIVFMNILYDTVQAESCDWATVREAFVQDPRIGSSHTEPVHTSGHISNHQPGQRGAGGHCFIKDFEAFRHLVAAHAKDSEEMAVLSAMVAYNNRLLKTTRKDIDLLEGVYGVTST